MIHRTQVSFSAYGKNFVPSQLSAPFTHFHDPGTIGASGRYKGIPQPYGWATLDAPETERDQIQFIHRIIYPLLPGLKEAGAEEFTLQISYHSDTESIGFSREEIKMIHALECDVPINCFRLETQ